MRCSSPVSARSASWHVVARAESSSSCWKSGLRSAFSWRAAVASSTIGADAGQPSSSLAVRLVRAWLAAPARRGLAAAGAPACRRATVDSPRVIDGRSRSSAATGAFPADDSGARGHAARRLGRSRTRDTPERSGTAPAFASTARRLPTSCSRSTSSARAATCRSTSTAP